MIEPGGIPDAIGGIGEVRIHEQRRSGRRYAATQHNDRENEMIPEDGDVPVDFKAAQPEDQITVAE